MKIPFLPLDPSLPLPEHAHPGDAGVDLVAAHDAVIDPGGRVLVGTGIAVAVPVGHAGWVVPRSGLAVRHGVTVLNAPGLVDSGYRGEVRVILVNLGSETFEVRRGDRIAQFVVTPFVVQEPVAVDELDDTTRGSGGFGSTGV